MLDGDAQRPLGQFRQFGGQRAVRGGDRLVPFGGGLDHGLVQCSAHAGPERRCVEGVETLAVEPRRVNHTYRHHAHRSSDRDDDPALERSDNQARHPSVFGARHVSGGEARQQHVIGGLVQHPGQLGQHDPIQAVRQRQRPPLRSEQQLAGLYWILCLDVRPAQFGQPGTDCHELSGALARQLVE